MSLIIASYILVFSLGYIVARLNDIAGKIKKTVKPIVQPPDVLSAKEYRTLMELLENPPKPPDWLIEAVRNKEPTKQSSSLVQNKPIEIDERLFITEMKTDNLEKKYDSSQLRFNKT